MSENTPRTIYHNGTKYIRADIFHAVEIEIDGLRGDKALVDTERDALRALDRANLNAAILAITSEAGKTAYLYPEHKRPLVRYIDFLEKRNARLQKELTRLQSKVVGLSEIRVVQPFHMWVEEVTE